MTRPRLFHAGDDRFDFGLRMLGQCALQIDPGAFRNADKGPDPPGERTAQARGAIDRQQAERVKEQPGAPSLKPIGEPWAGGRRRLHKRPAPLRSEASGPAPLKSQPAAARAKAHCVPAPIYLVADRAAITPTDQH
jgi:hypothetical protein